MSHWSAIVVSRDGEARTYELTESGRLKDKFARQPPRNRTMMWCNLTAQTRPRAPPTPIVVPFGNVRPELTLRDSCCFLSGAAAPTESESCS
jgi:hypothetical protein